MGAAQQALMSYGGAASATAGLIDSYATDLWGAYGLQRLRSSAVYSGSAIKVRRSSDNTTLDIGFVGTALDTAALATFVGANDGFIDTWYDQSGGGNHLAQATTSRQPQIMDAGTYIGEALIDGITQRMTTANSTSAVPAFSFYLGGRARLGSSPASGVLVTQGGGAQLIVSRVIGSADNFDGQVSTGTGSANFDNALTSDNAAHCAVIDRAGGGPSTECLLYVNGSLETVAATGGAGVTGNFTAGAVTLGSDGASAYGRLAAQTFLVYQAAHSGATVAAISALIRPALRVNVLDSYTTNLWGLYSLRHQRTAYAGDCIKVRRSSDNTTQNIGFVGGFLDTASMLTFVGGGNNGFVDTWFDQSGGGNDAVQATQANQPRICAGGVVDRGVKPDGTNDRLTTTNSSGTPTGMTVFAKGNNEASPAVVGPMVQHSATYNTQGGMTLYRFGNTTHVGVGNNGASAYATRVGDTNAAGQVLCARGDRTQASSNAMSTLFSGGQKLTTTDSSSGALPTGSFTARTWNIGGDGTYFMTGDIETVAIYQAALSDADIERISRLLG